MSKTLVAFTLILATAFAAFSDISLTSTYAVSSSVGIITGGVTSESFGAKVANAGKFTQTNYDDIVVGNGKNKAYVIRGQSAARSAALDLDVASASNFITITTTAGAADSVVLVACAGKFTSTTRDSLILAVPDYDIPSGNTKTGKAWIIYPRETDLNFGAVALPVASGVEIAFAAPAQDDYLGAGITTVGDVVGDTFDDIAITHTKGKAVYVIAGHGTATPASIVPTTGTKITAPSTATDFGAYLAGDFDFNGDQRDDFVIGQPAADKVYVITGSATNAGFTAIDMSSNSDAPASAITDRYTTIGITTGSVQFGFNVAVAGDVNNDGTDDLIVGAPASGSNVGKAYVIFGVDTATTATKVPNIADVAGLTPSATPKGFIIIGSVASLQLGFESDGVGDINADGYDDIVVSAPGAVAGRAALTGKVYVIYGRSTANTYNVDLTAGTGNTAFTSTVGFTITGEAGYGFGASVSAVGDVTGDGAPDFVVSAPLSPPRGLAATATSRTTPGVVYQFNGQAKTQSGSGFRLEASLLVIVSFFAALMF